MPYDAGVGRIVAFLMLCACGRHGFESPHDRIATADDSGDGASGDGRPGAPCDWTRNPRLDTHIAHPELAAAAGNDARLTLVPGDALTLYFTRYQLSGGFDMYSAQRSTTSASFSAPTLVAGLDRPNIAEHGLVVDANQLRGYAAIDSDIHEVQRTSLTAPFTIVRSLVEINTTQAVEFDPFVSADGLHLTFSKDTGIFQILEVSRSNTSEVFGAVQPFAFNSTAGDSTASYSQDRRVVVWRRGADVMFSVRDDASQPFTVAQPVLMTALFETEPFVRDDGCELFWVQEGTIMSATVLTD